MIVEKAKYTMWISIAILVAGILCGLLFGGLNLGIDFTGGSLTTIELAEEYDTKVVEDALDANGITGYQVVKSGDNWTSAVVRMKDIGDDQRQADVTADVLATIQETYPNASIESEDRVGGVASSELVLNAFISVLVACGLMLIYIWIRFELYSGLAAVIALAHDVAIMTAMMAILQMQVNSSYIAACLTIVGYSINNTIVIFDRVRDNKKTLGLKKHTLAELGNLSIKQTFRRTINTSVTTLIMLVVLYILGVDSIREFALPIIIGLIAGTYSSILVAVPLSIFFQKHLGKLKASAKTKRSAQKAKAAK